MVENFLNTAFYIRLSREDSNKGESESIITQKKILSQYIYNKPEFILFDIYIDDGYSGTNFERPSFQRMIEDIEKGFINCVIVKDLSRLGRNYKETGIYMEEFFPKNKVRFIAINDGYDSDSNDFEIITPIKNIFNEQYSRDISKKVRTSFKAKQKEGLFIGAFSCYGYKKSEKDKHKLVIDEYSSQVVKRIFALYIEGVGKVGIAKILNREGVLCPSEYKKINGEKYINGNRNVNTYYWTYSTIHKILKNEMYIGNMVQGKTKRVMKGKSEAVEENDWVVIKNTHQPIIDLNTWNTVQNLLKNRSSNIDFKSDINIFSGFIRCGECNRSMVKVKTKYGLRFNCGSYRRYGLKICSGHSISYDYIYNIILDDFNKFLNSVPNVEEIINSCSNSNSDKNILLESVEKMQKVLNSIKNKKKELYLDFKDGLLSKDEFIAIKNDYCSIESIYKENIKNAMYQIENYEFENDNFLNMLSTNKRIENLDRTIISKIIDGIYVYKDRRIEIRYRFYDDNN